MFLYNVPGRSHKSQCTILKVKCNETIVENFAHFSWTKKKNHTNTVSCCLYMQRCRISCVTEWLSVESSFCTLVTIWSNACHSPITSCSHSWATHLQGQPTADRKYSKKCVYWICTDIFLPLFSLQGSITFFSPTLTSISCEKSIKDDLKCIGECTCKHLPFYEMI